MDNADFIWHSEKLGGWIRFLRMDRGYSQLKLGELTGVTTSEIHRIEAGQQECRIETLLKLCGPLGTTPGWILDMALLSNISWFYHRIVADEDFKRLAIKLHVGDGSARVLACAGTLAAILVRASMPEKRVALESFPQDEWKRVFFAFAARLAEMNGDSTERATILHNLLACPVAELGRQGLIVEEVLKRQAKGKKGEGFMWFPSDVRFPREIKWE
ncbi:MAG TPA: helix-turn-helix transcriptional regulator [Candidatus Saccharimonadales bacterium]|nr:helix-turn-helix transcriptional regulator [Candidatus Saccharimonadales bacterium]